MAQGTHTCILLHMSNDARISRAPQQFLIDFVSHSFESIFKWFAIFSHFHISLPAALEQINNWIYGNSHFVAPNCISTKSNATKYTNIVIERQFCAIQTFFPVRSALLRDRSLNNAKCLETVENVFELNRTNWRRQINFVEAWIAHFPTMTPAPCQIGGCEKTQKWMTFLRSWRREQNMQKSQFSYFPFFGRKTKAEYLPQTPTVAPFGWRLRCSQADRSEQKKILFLRSPSRNATRNLTLSVLRLCVSVRSDHCAMGKE